MGFNADSLQPHCSQLRLKQDLPWPFLCHVMLARLYTSVRVYFHVSREDISYSPSYCELWISGYCLCAFAVAPSQTHIGVKPSITERSPNLSCLPKCYTTCYSLLCHVMTSHYVHRHAVQVVNSRLSLTLFDKKSCRSREVRVGSAKKIGSSARRKKAIMWPPVNTTEQPQSQRVV